MMLGHLDRRPERTNRRDHGLDHGHGLDIATGQIAVWENDGRIEKKEEDHRLEYSNVQCLQRTHSVYWWRLTLVWIFGILLT